MAARAGASGGGTKRRRSNRPGRRNAGSTCQGMFVAASTSTPSLDDWIPSISDRNWLMSICRPLWRMSLRLAPSASTSSKNSTHGRERRACSKISCRLRSTLAEPHVENLVDADGQEGGLDFAGRGAGQVRLAAAGRPIEKDAAARRLAVGLVEFGVRQRMNDFHPHFLLDRLHAAHVPEGDARPFHRAFGRCAHRFGRLADPAVHDLGAGGRVEAEALGELRVGRGRVGVDRLAVLPNALRHVAGAKEQSGVEEIGAGRRPVRSQQAPRRRRGLACSCPAGSTPAPGRA